MSTLVTLFSCIVWALMDESLWLHTHSERVYKVRAHQHTQEWTWHAKLCIQIPIQLANTHTYSIFLCMCRHSHIHTYRAICVHIQVLTLKGMCAYTHTQKHTYADPRLSSPGVGLPPYTLPSLLRWCHSSILSPSLSACCFIYLFTSSRPVCFLSKTNWKE